MVRHKGRDGPPTEKRDRGRNDCPTSIPRPTQSESEPIVSNSSRMRGPDETGSAGVGSGTTPGVVDSGAAADADFHGGYPVILRKRSSGARRHRGELVVIGKRDRGERARCLESLILGDGLSDDEGLAGVREPCWLPLPDSNGAVAIEPGREGGIASV